MDEGRNQGGAAAPVLLLAWLAFAASAPACTTPSAEPAAAQNSGLQSADAGADAGGASLQPWQPFSKIGDKPYLTTPPLRANGFAMTWDARLLIQTTNISGVAPAKTFGLGALKLTSGQVEQAGPLALTMQTNCDVVLSLTSAGQTSDVWSSGTVGQCSDPEVIFQGDGNFVLYGGNGQAVWASNTAKVGQQLAFYEAAPYIGVTYKDSGQEVFAWPSAGTGAANGSTSGWVARLFQPETLAASPSPIVGSAQAPGGSSVQSALGNSFSAATTWAIPNTVFATMFPGAQQLALPSLNSVAITPAAGYVQNPYPSDASGNPVAVGTYRTYKITLYSIDYGEVTLVTMPVTAIVANADTPSASLVSVQATGPVRHVTDVSGNAIAAIEPTGTFDGCLLVYQRFGNTSDVGAQYYTFNPSCGATPAQGWAVPKRVTAMATDPAIQAKGYPIGRYPMRDATGSPFAKSPLLGAYAWLSPDGADLFIQAVQSEDGARRAGSAVIGASTRGMLRQIDGGPNVTRTSMKPLERLFVSSLGRTPGMWSPLERTETRTLPLTDKPFTYPMFASNDAVYFDVSFEETLAGNYDLYLDMAEAIGQGGVYDTALAQDVSGHFHSGRKNAGAMSPEEAFPTACTWSSPQTLSGCLGSSGGCASTSCPMDDPWSGQANLFSGKAIYFTDSGLLTAAATSPTGHTILAGAQDLTVSLAVMPILDLSHSADNSGYRVLVSQPGTFNIILEQDRKVSGTVWVTNGGVSTQERLTFVGSPLPLNTWSAIAMTYSSSLSTMTISINGQLAGTQAFAAPGGTLTTSPAADVLVGPNVTSDTSAAVVYALDQVGVSRVVRTSEEIARQAGLVVPRLTPSQMPNVLPMGIQVKDVQSPILLSRPLDPNAVELGHYLFFDPRLSQENSTSCSTCHVASLGFTSPLPLATNRLAATGALPNGLRHVPGLFIVGLEPQFFWDGRAASLSDQAGIVIDNPSEMGTDIAGVLPKLAATPNYPAMFAAAFPGQESPITAANLQAALQEFELSLSLSAGAGASLFDQYRAGRAVLTSDELAGMALFFGKARCAQCHAGSGFSDGLFHNPSFLDSVNEDGVVDQGRASFTHGVDDVFQFKTPSLRNVSLTGPYFHNGSVATLADVVALYNSVGPVGGAFTKNSGPQDDMLMPIGLSAEEQTQLIDFLGTLASSLPTIAAPAYPGGLPKPAPPPGTPTGCSTVDGGDGVVRGTHITSCDGRFVLTLQGSDGNLVLYEGSTPLWASNTAGDSSAVAVMQDDGDFALLDRTGSPLWSSGTAGNPGAHLSVQNDGNLVVYSAANKPLWASNTCCH